MMEEQDMAEPVNQQELLSQVRNYASADSRPSRSRVNWASARPRWRH
jgi:hypothetical protein